MRILHAMRLCLCALIVGTVAGVGCDSGSYDTHVIRGTVTGMSPANREGKEGAYVAVKDDGGGSREVWWRSSRKPSPAIGDRVILRVRAYRDEGEIVGVTLIPNE